MRCRDRLYAVLGRRMVILMTSGETRITEVARRSIFDRITLEKLSWPGRREEPDFLARFYKLREMYSKDSRFGEAHERFDSILACQTRPRKHCHSVKGAYV